MLFDSSIYHFYLASQLKSLFVSFFFTQDPSQLPPASLVAEKLLGTSVFVNWPMMHEAKVNDWDQDRTIARQHRSYEVDVRILFNSR